MPIDSIRSGMVDAMIPILEFTAEGAPSGAVVTRLGPYGMELACGQVPPRRYAWLGFELPTGDSIKALAEIVGVVGESGGTRVLVRFKHLFPRDRVAMEGFMNARVAA